MGVSISVFNLVSKMFNIPLLNVTTSFVAEDASEEQSSADTTSQKSESTPLLSIDRTILSRHLCFPPSYVYRVRRRADFDIIHFNCYILT